MLFIYHIIILTSSREIFDNIQNIMLEKYKNKDYIDVQKNEMPIAVTIKLDLRGAQWDEQRFFNDEEDDLERFYCSYKFDDEDINIKETVTKILKHDDNRKNERNIYFNIFKKDMFNLNSEKLCNVLVEEIIKKNDSKRKVHFLNGIDGLRNFLSFEKDSFFEVECSVEDLYFHFGVKLEERYLFFTISGSEINYRKYILDSLQNSNFFKLKDESLSKDLFKTFNFSRYAYYNSREIDEENIFHTFFDRRFNCKKDTNWNYGNNYFSNFYPEADVIIKYLQRYKVTNKMKKEIVNFFHFSQSLSKNDLQAVILLYYSISEEIKILLINRLLDFTNQNYSIILFYLLEKMDLISYSKRDLLSKINLTHDHFYKGKVGRIFLENYVDRHNLRLIILKNIFNLTSSYHLHFVILFCKFLDEIFFSEDLSDKKFILYERIFEKLDIKKESGNLLKLFNYLLVNYDSFSNLVCFEKNIVCCMFTNILGCFYRFRLYQGTVCVLYRMDVKDILMEADLDPLNVKEKFKKILKQ